MKIKLHGFDWYFIYPRANKWADGNKKTRIQFGWLINVEIILA
jgi:hypothetical protein